MVVLVQVMARDTSREAYNKIKEMGLLSQRRWEVYDILYSHGPMTGGEICDVIRQRWASKKQGDSFNTIAGLVVKGLFKPLYAVARLIQA